MTGEDCPWLKGPTACFRPPSDLFFADGNKACNIHTKELNYIIDEEENLHKTYPKFFCAEAGCSETFVNVVSYEGHYNSVHRNVCPECRKNLPSVYLLGVHMSELHDSYFDARVEKAHEMLFECLVEQCNEKFNSPDDRKFHLLNCHRYPANYRFLDMFRRTSKSNQMDTTEEPDTSKSTAPKYITFGHGASRTFHRSKKGKSFKPWNQSLRKSENSRKNIDETSVSDLKEALMDVVDNNL